MDGINPGRQCQFDIEDSNDLHTTTTTILYILSRLTSFFSFFFLKIVVVVVVVWYVVLYRPRISTGYGNWRRVNSHIYYPFVLFIHRNLKRVGRERERERERKDFFFFLIQGFRWNLRIPSWWGDDV